MPTCSKRTRPKEPRAGAAIPEEPNLNPNHSPSPKPSWTPGCSAPGWAQAQNGVTIFTLQVQFDQQGRYLSKDQLSANNRIMAYEEEGGVYQAQGGKVNLKVTQSSTPSNVNNQATLTYVFQGANLVFYGVPAISGQPIYMRKMQ